MDHPAVGAAVENTIYLSRRESGWVATYFGPHARGVIELFGTAEFLPTAYGSLTAADVVGESVARLNPGVLVYSVEGGRTTHHEARRLNVNTDNGRWA